MVGRVGKNAICGEALDDVVLEGALGGRRGQLGEEPVGDV